MLITPHPPRPVSAQVRLIMTSGPTSPTLFEQCQGFFYVPFQLKGIVTYQIGFCTLSRSVNRYSKRSGSKCVWPTEIELNIQECGLGFSTSTSTKFDVWERFALVLRRCLSYSGFAQSWKSLNFRGSPWKVLEFHFSMKSPWIFFSFECSGLERVFWCFWLSETEYKS